MRHALQAVSVPDTSGMSDGMFVSGLLWELATNQGFAYVDTRDALQAVTVPCTSRMSAENVVVCF